MDTRKRIVVALGQDALALALWRGLHGQREDVDVHLARRPDVLATLLDGVAPDVVVLEIMDARAETMAALAELCGRDRAPRVIAVSRDRSPRADDALVAAGVEAIRHAPCDVPALVEVVESVLRAEETMRGRLGPIGILDLVQMLCMSGRSGSVRFASTAGRGGIWLERGDIVHAVWRDSAGMDALVQLTTLDDGAFRAFGPGVPPRRTISEAWRHALMTAACLADERRARHGTQELPAQTADVVPVNRETAPRKWQVRYQELTDLGLAAMRAGDFAAARRAWTEAKQLQEEHADDPDQPDAATSGIRLAAHRVPASA